jgi:hypothetical protein
MRQLILILAIVLTGQVFGQMPNDSIYQSWWENKENSIFSLIDCGQFSGNTYGYLQLITMGKN